MPEATPAAAPSAASPAPIAVAADTSTPPTTSSAAVQPVAAATPEKKAEPTPEQKDQERRAAILASAKRVEASNRKASEAVKAEREKLRQEQVAWEQRQASVLKDAEEKNRFTKLLAEDPLKFMEAAGLSQQAILERMVKGDVRTPEEIAQAVVDKALAQQKAKRDEEDKAAQAAASKAELEAAKQGKANLIKELTGLLEKDPERYEYCSLRPDSAQLAYQVMDNHYAATLKNGRAEIMPYAEALDKVEEALEADFQKFQSTSKKLAAKAAAAAEEKKKAEAAAVVAEQAKVARSRFFTESTPRPGKSAPAEAPAAVRPAANNNFSIKSRRQLVADLNAQLLKSREQQ